MPKFIKLVLLAYMFSIAVATTSQATDQHQKTIGALPDGAPLPDCTIPLNDRISPESAYSEAIKRLKIHEQVEATEYFERAIGALRRSKGHLNKRLARKIVLKYGNLLRAHQGAQKADSLEKEFGN